MRLSARWRAAVSFLIAAGCAPHALFAADDTPKLVVISIDGLDYRLLRDADKLHLKIPVLRKMMGRGAVADGVIGVAPSESWPSTISLVTGVQPFRHGVIAGYRPDLHSKTPTLWDVAERAHRKVALLNWPATGKTHADYVCPQVWEKPEPGDVPFDLMADKCTKGLVNRVAGVYSRFTKSLWNDESAVMALEYLLQFEKPDLSLIHLTDLSAEERETGALSIYSREALENDDELLGQIFTHLSPRTTVALVSGNSYESEDHVVRPRALTGSTAVEVKYGLIGATADASAAELRKLLAGKKNGLAREVPMAEVHRYAPEEETGNWVAAFATLPGYVAVSGSQKPGVGPGSHKGVDGLWPVRPGYRSVFMLAGGEIRPTHLGEISILQIAPTLASAIGLSLPETGQESLWPTIRK